MLHFEGDRGFSQPPAELWARLSDPRFLVGCIPGSESVREAAADHAVCMIRPGFAFVRGTLEVTLKVVEAVAPASVRLELHSKGIGSSSDVAAALALTPQDAGTRVHWTADVQSLGGLLKAMPPGLIRGAAEKVIGDVWTNVTARLQEGPAASGPGAQPKEP
jgi:carbon monoxide dehydrogenase subunit G